MRCIRLVGLIVLQLGLISRLEHRSHLLGIVILILLLTYCLFLYSYILSNILRIRLVGNAIRVLYTLRVAPLRYRIDHSRVIRVHRPHVTQRIVLRTYRIISYIITHTRRHIITYTRQHNITNARRTYQQQPVPHQESQNRSQESHRKVETIRRNPKNVGGPGKMKSNSVYVWESENTYIAPYLYRSSNAHSASPQTAPGLQKFFIIFFFTR